MNTRALELLAADGPHPAYPKELDLYGQFVGSWQVANRSFDETTGRWYENSFEWAFGWVLNGRAVQDVIRVPADQTPTGEVWVGTTIRVYDPKLDAWRVNWFGPGAGLFCSLIGRAHGDEIRQDGSQHDGRPIRWNFSDISDTGFTWRGYVSDDDGVTWRLEQEMRATR